MGAYGRLSTKSNPTAANVNDDELGRELLVMTTFSDPQELTQCLQGRWSTRIHSFVPPLFVLHGLNELPPTVGQPSYSMRNDDTSQSHTTSF